MSSLPQCAVGSLTGEVQLEVIFEIRRDGSIAGARMLHTSGDPVWDHAAMETMKQWRFAAVPSLDDSSTLAVRTRVIVRPEERLALPLGSLVVTTLAEADALAALLKAGASFDSLAATPRWDSPEKRGHHLGITDIGTYPHHVRTELRSLRAGRVTPPLKLGAEYVIFKRYAVAL
jgi:TonB family protein